MLGGGSPTAAGPSMHPGGVSSFQPRTPQHPQPCSHLLPCTLPPLIPATLLVEPSGHYLDLASPHCLAAEPQGSRCPCPTFPSTPTTQHPHNPGHTPWDPSNVASRRGEWDIKHCFVEIEFTYLQFTCCSIQPVVFGISTVVQQAP